MVRFLLTGKGDLGTVVGIEVRIVHRHEASPVEGVFATLVRKEDGITTFRLRAFIARPDLQGACTFYGCYTLSSLRVI